MKTKRKRIKKKVKVKTDKVKFNNKNMVQIECEFIVNTIEDFNRIVKHLESDGWILYKKIIDGNFHQAFMAQTI